MVGLGMGSCCVMASSATKTVLVCIREGKRQVFFASDGQDNKKTLLPAVQEVFSDIFFWGGTTTN